MPTPLSSTKHAYAHPQIHTPSRPSTLHSTPQLRQMLHTRDRRLETPLLAAVRLNRPASVEALLLAGASPAQVSANQPLPQPHPFSPPTA